MAFYGHEVKPLRITSIRSIVNSVHLVTRRPPCVAIAMLCSLIEDILGLGGGGGGEKTAINYHPLRISSNNQIMQDLVSA